MNYRRSILTIFLSGIIFSLLGGTIGFLLGKFLPDYYQGVFSAGQNPEFNPIAVGVGQGVTQGLMAGIAIGLIVIIIDVLSQARRHRKD
ncbi:MAG: hypothetical protein CMO55_11170 [Verrucomicrobiales bacterium]|nr:hypothetical protein [Verrucomicrobiales bacterium]